MTSSRVLASAVAALLAITGGCGDDLLAPGPDSLVVDTPAATLRIGEQLQVTATFHKGNAELAADHVAWASSDPGRAVVRGSGPSATITAVAAGSATIIATGDDLSATIAVSISPALLTGIAIAPVVPALPAGTTRAVTVTAGYSDGTTSDVTGAVSWHSAQPETASVTGGVLSAGTKGDTTITATYLDHSSSTHVFVTDAVLRAIDVAPAAPAVALGQTLQLTATGHFTDGTTRDVTAVVAWASSALAIATISNAAGSQGLATTLAVGPTTITASAQAITGSAMLTVDPSALVSIAVTPAGDVALTADQQLTALGTFSDGSTMDLTTTVVWASADPTIATVDASGLASALALGPTTITAQRGPVTSNAQLTVVLPAVGPWLAVPGFVGRPCHDGIQLSMAADFVYVCTTANGVARSSVAADGSLGFTTSPGTEGRAGLAIAAHTFSATAMMFMTAPSGTANNWFRSTDSAATFSPFLLADSAGNPRFLYAGRFQPMIGNILGSWDPGTAGAPQAIVITGMNPPTAIHPVAIATGTVRSITANPAAELYVGVLGQTPAGTPATGGVFHSTNRGSTWTAIDAGMPAADRDLASSIVLDPANPLTLYVGLAGGGRVYKTIDGGASWSASAVGIPARARVSVLLISPQDPATLFAATDRGLYRTIDAGATWSLVGFQGRAVTSIAQSPALPSLILVGVDDDVGLYRAQ